MFTTIMMNSTTLLNSQFKISETHHHHRNHKSPLLVPKIQATLSSNEETNHVSTLRRRKIITTLLATTSMAALVAGIPPAMAENWGNRSFIWEKYFSPSLSPEDAAARIRQTAQGLHSLREMLETMSWKYVLYYIRQKQDYLNRDMKIAITTIPKGQWKSYVAKANELVDNMNELDEYVRSPKVYESYLYYEKCLNSIDDLVALLS
ncbi:OLC1v1032750C2 [Oldenlandia corymbosa var. corymbosa]|uniref:OLC1v1032750C2 n=1 Tax=Oldenlandia corymbosa var. corymbosa TaxID=529605 RepID=A0AAV1CLT3_OLDCO|nr:OLC1v1032750C2 [Oldenlandia corymbosa var. corymbosa]